jgi:hypothetical protein
MYAIKCEGMKEHFANSETTAKAIAADLEARTGETAEIVYTEGAPTFLMNLDTCGSKDLALVKVAPYYEADTLAHRLDMYLQTEPRESMGVKYYKIHGPVACLVLTPEEAAVTLMLCRD